MCAIKIYSQPSSTQSSLCPPITQSLLVIAIQRDRLHLCLISFHPLLWLSFFFFCDGPLFEAVFFLFTNKSPLCNCVSTIYCTKAHRNNNSGIYYSERKRSVKTIFEKEEVVLVSVPGAHLLAGQKKKKINNNFQLLHVLSP